MERLDDSGLANVDESDPRSMARWAKTMGDQMGDGEMGEDFDQAVEEIGESPSGIGRDQDDEL
jgi:hypothetical protein